MNTSAVEVLVEMADVWPETIYTGFAVGRQNPHHITSPHVIRTMPISDELQFARQKRSSPIYSPCSCGHVDIFSVQRFNVVCRGVLRR